MDTLLGKASTISPDALKPVGTAWRPIEEAPKKSFSPVFLFVVDSLERGGIIEGCWNTNTENWQLAIPIANSDMRITHWAPIDRILRGHPAVAEWGKCPQVE